MKRTFLAALNVFLIDSGNGPSLRFSVIIIQKNNKANMVFNELGTQFLYFFSQKGNDFRQNDYTLNVRVYFSSSNAHFDKHCFVVAESCINIIIIL